MDLPKSVILSSELQIWYYIYAFWSSLQEETISEIKFAFKFQKLDKPVWETS